MVAGKVKWFDVKKGYGFILSEDGEDIFVHYSEIKSEGFKKLVEGQEVELEVERNEKGLKAKNVMIKGV